jgi:hypothetical protein
MAKKRTNIIRTSPHPIITASRLTIGLPAIVEDARMPNRYRMLVSAVDVVFADVAQRDQARIVIHNAQSFLKDGGHVLISIKASCIDSTAAPETIFAAEVEKLKESQFKPIEQVTLEPYERDHAMVSGESQLIFDFSLLPTAHLQLYTNGTKRSKIDYFLCVPVLLPAILSV